MKVKDLTRLLSKYPGDAEIFADVSTRDFQENLCFGSSHYDEKGNAVMMNYTFEIGWKDNHPEFCN